MPVFIRAAFVPAWLLGDAPLSSGGRTSDCGRCFLVHPAVEVNRGMARFAALLVCSIVMILLIIYS